MNFREHIKQGTTELAFWFKREFSITLLFWLVLFAAVFIRSLLQK